MIASITNFAVSSITVEDNVQTIIFEFDIHTDPNIGGYELFKSTDTSGHSISCDIKVDESANQSSIISTYNNLSTRKTYFSYTLPEEDFGRKIYYSIEAIAANQEHSSRTTDLVVYTLLSTPENLVVGYDNYDTSLSWDALDTTDSKNSQLSNYAIYRTEMSVPADAYLDAATGALVSDAFTYQSYVYVVDIQKKSIWYGQVSIEGVFFATDSNRSSFVFDLSQDYSARFRNLAIYVVDHSTTPSLLGYTQNTSYTDTTPKRNSSYLYYVAAINPNQALSNYATYPIITQALQDKSPYLRSIDNSPIDYFQQPYWKYLKNVLIDHNYYNKNKFDIPAIKGKYLFKGYLGISNAKVDVYLNGNHNQYVITDSYGNFEFGISLSKGTSQLQLHARDYKNIGFSRKSTKQTINIVNLYSFFAALGKEYTDIWTEINLQKDDLSLTESRFEAFEERISSLIGYYRDISEEEEPYRNIAIAIYLAYEYGGYREALNIVLDAFQENIDEFDHYEIYYNNSLYDPKKTGRSFVINSSTGEWGLERDNYYYGVTSVSGDQESSATTLRIDNRWWPTSTGLESSTGYQGFNVIMWPEVNGIETYNIYKYKGSNSVYDYSNLTFVSQLHANLFVDISNNNLLTSTGTPPLYTFTSFDHPTEVVNLLNTKVSSEYLAQRKANYITIIVYAVDNEDIPDFQLDRLLSIFPEVIPPELAYRVIYCNDLTSEFLV